MLAVCVRAKRKARFARREHDRQEIMRADAAWFHVYIIRQMECEWDQSVMRNRHKRSDRNARYDSSFLVRSHMIERERADIVEPWWLVAISREKSAVRNVCNNVWAQFYWGLRWDLDFLDVIISLHLEPYSIFNIWYNSIYYAKSVLNSESGFLISLHDSTVGVRDLQNKQIKLNRRNNN